MTDSLPPDQRRPPDAEEGGEPGWIDEPAKPDGGVQSEEQPGFPDAPTSPAEGGD